MTAVRDPHELTAPLWWLAVAATAAVLLVPLFMTSLPPLLDYPNHLARMMVIAADGGDPVLARMYRIDWRVVPNLGMDVLVPPLTRVMPLLDAGRLFVAVVLLLPVAGVIALHRAAFGRRSLWPLTSLLVAYNGLFLMGFLNYVASLGLALLAMAAWLWFGPTRPIVRIVVTSVLALAMFFCHLFPLAPLGLVLLMIEIEQLRRAGIRAPGAVVRRLGVLLLPFVLPTALFLFAAPLGAVVTHDGPLQLLRLYYWQIIRPDWMKWRGALSPFLTYDLRLDAVALLAVLLLYIGWIARHGVAVSRPLLLAAGLCALAYPLTPSIWLTAVYVDWRWPLFAVCLAIAALLPRPGGRTGRVAAVVVAALLVLRIGVVAAVWHGHQADVVAFRRVIAAVPAGSRVLVAITSPLPERAGLPAEPASRFVMVGRDATMHMAALLLIDRRAFWPALFTSRTLQIVHVRPPFDVLSAQAKREQALLPFYGSLFAPTPEALELTPYIADWRRDFDYLLVIRPNALPPADPPVSLHLLASSDIAALYRILK